MTDIVKSSLDVGVYDPFLSSVGTGEVEDLGDSIMASSARSESIACALGECFPAWFESVLDLCLQSAVNHRWNTERSEFAVSFGNVHPSGRFGSPGLVGADLVNQFSSGLWCFHNQLVHT